MSDGIPSCERCKRRKSRCDRVKPACSRCTKARAECHYSARKKPGFPAGQRQGLEDKIEKMEAALRDLRAARSSPLSAPGDVSGPAALLHSTAHNESTRAMIGDSMEMTARPFPGPDGLGNETPTAERTQRVLERKPPQDLLISLGSLFFHHIHPWFPFLDARRAMSNLGFNEDGPLLNYALFGISLPFSHDSRLDKSSSDSFWKFTKRRILIEVLEEPSYNSLEALTVLTLDLSGMTNGAQVWGALTVATRLALLLKNTGSITFRTSAGRTSDTIAGDQDQVCKHRLFWAVYALDCYVSITTPSQIDSFGHEIDYFKSHRTHVWQKTRSAVGPESNDNHNEQELIETRPTDPESVFYHHLVMLDLSREVHRIYIGFRELYESDAVARWIEALLSCSAKLFSWSADLPRALQLDALPHHSNSSHNCLSSLITLHAYWCALSIHLHSLVSAPALLEYAELNEARQQCHDHCMRAADQLAGIICHVNDKTIKQLGWPFAWSLWVALRYLLICQYHTVMDVPQSWSLLSQCLQSTGKYWQIAVKYWCMLERATQELQQRLTDPVPRTHKYLPLLTDLRISTAELEDYFRVDPVLHTRQRPYGKPSSISDTPFPYQHSQRSSATDDSMLGDQEMSAISTFQGLENWYGMPLYASSAYQQSYQSTFDYTTPYT